jgi:hypothetical protein
MNFPKKELAVEYDRFIAKGLRNERTNYNSWIKAFWETWEHYLIGFVTGVAASAIVAFIFYLFTSK